MAERIILTGTTGMVGQCVLLAALDDPQVGQILSLTRRPSGRSHPKLRELLVPDFYDLSALEPELVGYDACLHCLGVSAVGKSEADYIRVTYDLTLHLAQTLLRLNPSISFAYVTGAGTDSTGQGRQMWARVKGRTENALLAMPFRHVHMFRPGFIRPAPGVRSSTAMYQAFYVVLRPVFSLLLAFPGIATTGFRLGHAMLKATRLGFPKAVLESRDINRFGQ